MGICASWDDSFINNRKNISKHRQQNKDEFCWEYLDRSLNNCEGLIQWLFVFLGKTLT